MLQTLFIMFLMMSSFLFFSMTHPLSLGLMLMIQTIMIVLFSGLMTKTFWFSYSLFLIFLGGMLILFMYMTSIASNEQFKFRLNPLMIFIGLSFFLMTLSYLFLFNQKLMFFNKPQNLENMNLFLIKNLTLDNTFMLNKMYNFPMNLITILLINYLFLTLIACVKITNIFEGPLRPKN
uniref:NADH dehydrogenase subunit 6 n=1 Tax=Polypedilum yongsanensis TaxID=1005982 RepID=UPI0023F154B8|nr:NADH dehydrogenase subunit 6 [Polypedilum yongsanensis]WEF49701.1 NADH dehydrogenase subunit 6 [Polypedilum yongsanensis]